MTYFMGIDGGGSSVRVVIISRDLTVCGQSYHETSVNPNVVGHDAALHTVQAAMRSAIVDAHIEPESISAVGIGIAGALTGKLPGWLHQVVTGVTPHARVVPGADAEIALVGAHGERRGILIIAGTGSIAYGVNSAGDTAIVGGWGYLLGDEGSGYWLGINTLQAAVRALDGRGPRTPLVDAALAANNLYGRDALVQWTYHPQPRTREIAGLAPLVIEHAEKGDTLARELVETAARELALAVRAVKFQLKMESLPIAFAGGLLSAPNPLSALLCENLGLASIPVPRYPPVIGAAILAMLSEKKS